MKSCTSWTISLGLLTLFFIRVPANAAEPQVATVVAARGDVQALAVNGQSRKLTVKAPLFAEDTIETGAGGRVQIMFTDNTLVSLGKATTMKIAEYRWQPERNDGALKTRIKEGAFRVMGGALAQAAPKNFKTETPTATIGIRGSMYAGVATADSLSVLFQGGKGIEITNDFGTVTITKPGYGTKAALGRPPSGPVKFSALEMGELGEALNDNGAEGKEENNGAQEPDKAGSSGVPGQDDEQKETASREELVPPSNSAAASNFSDGDNGTGAEPRPEATVEVRSVLTATDPAAVVSRVTDQLTRVAVDTSQTTLSREVSGSSSTTSTTSTTTATGGTGIGLAGNYRFFLRDIDLTQPDPLNFNSTFLNYDTGAANAVLLSTGRLAGTLANGDTFGPYLISGYDPAAISYAGFSTSVDSISYLDSTLGPLTLTSKTYADSGGQFFYNNFHNTIDLTADYLISRLIYAGIPSTSIPAEGIDIFTGHIMHNSTTGTSYDADLEQASLEVSYYNRRIIGRTSATDPAAGKNDGVIFFGSLNSDGSANLSVVAGGAPSFGGTGVSSPYGAATGNLYGNFNQGLAFTAAGSDYSIIDNTLTSNWEATGAALRSPTTKFISSYPTTPLIYTGFVVGVADDTSTGAASRIFMSSAAADFSMTANPTTGVIAGSINAAELTSAGAMTLSGLTVGGTVTNSAYIGTENMVATLSGSSLALADHGNLLYNNGPLAPQITSVANDYLTWGSWEIAYIDPLDGSRDHLFGSQSFFIAGQQTDPTYITGIMNTPFSGTYTGKAFGVELDSTGQNAMPLTNGATNLTVNFQDPAIANAITGSISFDQATLAINSAASSLNSNGFTAYVSSVSGTAPLTSAVNGAFYGQAAEAVGGNFNAKMNTGTAYLGIFGGNR